MKFKTIGVGKIIEKLLVSWLLLCLGISIMFFAILYRVMSEYGQGVVSTSSNQIVTLLDCLYFSVVTISSLGYGDFRPVGYGRLVAAIEVMLGLVLIALFVARIASERTATLTKLLYTSETHRILRVFHEELDVRRARLVSADEREYESQRTFAVRRLYVHLTSLTRFYNYQKNVGGLSEDWATDISLRIANAVQQLMDELTNASLSAGARKVTVRRIELVLSTCGKLIDDICAVHESYTGSKIKKRSIASLNMYEIRRKKGVKRPLEINSELKEIVRLKLPKGPWPKNIHKAIAADLGWSNQTAHRVINSIVEDMT